MSLFEVTMKCFVLYCCIFLITLYFYELLTTFYEFFYFYEVICLIYYRFKFIIKPLMLQSKKSLRWSSRLTCISAKKSIILHVNDSAKGRKYVDKIFKGIKFDLKFYNDLVGKGDWKASSLVSYQHHLLCFNCVRRQNYCEFSFVKIWVRNS